MTDDGHRQTNARRRVPTRVAVVGMGQFGTLHLQAFQAHPDCEVVAVVDRDEQRALEAARRYGVERTFTSMTEMLERTHPDALSIVTAGRDHLTPALEALSAGASVLLEKPVVMSGDEGDILLAAERDSRGFVMPAHILRFTTAYRALHERVWAGAVGRPRALSFRRHRTSDHDARFPDVHPAFMTTIHDVDLALWLTRAKPLTVTSTEVLVEGRAQPAVVWSQVQATDGSVWSFQTSWMLSDDGALPDELEVIGEDGLLSLAMVPQLREFGTATVAVDDALTPPGRRGALYAEIDHFLECVRSSRASELISLQEAVDGVRLAEQIVAQGIAVRRSEL